MGIPGDGTSYFKYAAQTLSITLGNTVANDIRYKYHHIEKSESDQAIITKIVEGICSSKDNIK